MNTRHSAIRTECLHRQRPEPLNIPESPSALFAGPPWLSDASFGATSDRMVRAVLLAGTRRSRKSVSRWSPDDIGSPTGYSRQPRSPGPVQVLFKPLSCSSCLRGATGNS